MTSQDTEQKVMHCIEDGTELQPAEISGQPVMRCPTCHDAWISDDSLHEMEDNALGADAVKGQRRYGEHAVDHNCPHCGEQMTRFRYRGYSIELEACPQCAGF